jgi:hypothetical protein
MPRERRDLISAIIASRANWTNEEIIVWLDNKEKQEQDEYNKLKSEFTGNGNKFTKNRHKDISQPPPLSATSLSTPLVTTLPL